MYANLSSRSTTARSFTLVSWVLDVALAVFYWSSTLFETSVAAGFAQPTRSFLAKLGFLGCDVEFYSALLHVSTPCPDGENGHRRCRAVVGPTSHGVREGREGAARHRIAISTSGEHRAAAAEGASRGENRPFGLSPANEWLPMPTATSPMGNVRSRTVWTYRSASGLGGSRAERRRSRRHGMRVAARAAAAGDAFDRFGRMATSRSQDSDRSRRHACVIHAYLPF